MKRILFTTALFIFVLVNGFTQNASTVVVFSQEGEQFYVVVDGIRQNEAPQTNVKVTGLTAPNYKFKVIFADQNIPSIDKNVFAKNADDQFTDASYAIKKNNKGVYVMNLSSYDVAKGVVTNDPNQYNAPLVITNNQTSGGTVVTQQTTVVNQTTTSDPNGAAINMNVVDPNTGENINMNVSANVTGTGNVQSSSTTYTTTTTTTTSSSGGVVTNDHYIMQGYNGAIGCPWPMSDMDYGSAKQSISTKSFESDKLTIAKQVLGSNCMTCAQIRDIMTMFSFEDSRLDFAKYAYGYVYDPGNYYKLNDAFQFSSSIDELNNYINGVH
jgi:hypothetical protein